MKNSQELIEIIKSNNLQECLFRLDCDYLIEYVYDTNGEEFETDEQVFDYLKTLGLDNFEQVYYVSNTDEMYTVIHFKDDNVYLKLVGEYDSYGQMEHDFNCGMYQVFPKEVKVVEYFKQY